MNTSPDSSQDSPDETNDRARFQWSASGWFGSVFGCTLWMTIGAAVVAPSHALLSAGLFGFFLLAVGLGCWFYRKRSAISFLRAAQLYMLAMFAISLTYIAVAAGADALELIERTWSYPVGVSAWIIPGCYLVCLVFVTYLHSRVTRPREV